MFFQDSDLGGVGSHLCGKGYGLCAAQQRLGCRFEVRLHHRQRNPIQQWTQRCADAEGAVWPTPPYPCRKDRVVLRCAKERLDPRANEEM